MKFLTSAFLQLVFVVVAAQSVFGAGSVNQAAPQQMGTTGNWYLTFYWTGDAVNGSVPDTNAQLAGCCSGFFFTSFAFVPGTPSPTNGYSVQIRDGNGVDVLAAGGAALSSTIALSLAAPASAPPVSSFRLVVTGQNVANAKGTVIVYMQKPGTVNVASIGRSSSGSGSGLPAGLQSQYLRIKTNVGNQTTPEFNDIPRFEQPDFNFPAQRCAATNICMAGGPIGAALAIGSNTLVLSPVPLGMNGSNTFHKVWVSGGSGTAEACTITGGTGTSGSGAGQIIISCANTHTGAFTIQSISAGITEALQAIKTAGRGGLHIPGSVSTFDTILLPAGIPHEIAGDGINSTLITLSNGSNVDVMSVENFSALTSSNTAPAGIYRATIHDLTVDGNMSNQSGTSWCFRVYGHGYTLRDLAFQQCLTGGAYSEYAVDPPLGTTATDLEAYWSNIRVKLTGGDNILFRGPHDSYLDRIVSDECALRCFAAEGNASYNGNVHLSHFDGYNGSLSGAVPICEAIGVALVGTAVTCSGSVAGSDGLRLVSAQSVNLTAGNFQTLGAGGFGLVMGGDLNFVQGIANSVKLGLTARNIIDLAMSCSNAAACITNANDQGNEIIRVVNGSTLPLWSGVIPDSNSIQIFSSSVPTSGFQFLSRTVNQSNWYHYSVVKIANGTGGCVNANGCWSVNHGTPVAASAALTQAIVLETIPTSAMVNTFRLQTATAATGPATVLADIGNTGAPSLYGGAYDLKAAVSASNLVDVRPSVSANTNGAQAMVLSITTTGSNVDQIANGAAVDCWVQWVKLQ